MSQIQSELARLAAQLTVQVQGLSQSVAALSRKQRRDRALLAWTISGLFVSLVALVLLGVVAVQAREAGQNADSARTLSESNRVAAQLTCEANNQSRAVQVQLWTYVLDTVTTNNTKLTREQAKRLAEFRTYVQKVFSPRDCSLPITPTPPPTTPTR